MHIIQGKTRQLSGKDLDLCLRIQTPVQNKPALPSDHTEAARSTFQIHVRDVDFQAVRKGLEFLKQLGFSHIKSAGFGSDNQLHTTKSISPLFDSINSRNSPVLYFPSSPGLNLKEGLANSLQI